jgi:hypothetical protein
MTHHQHNPDTTHPSEAIPLSLLRMPAWQRLAAAITVAVLLWAAVWWATA